MPNSLNADAAARRSARVGPRLGDVGVNPEDERSVDSLDELGVPELRRRLKDLGLPASGKKAELVARLSAA